MSSKKIKVEDDETLFRGKYLTLVRRHFRGRTGKKKFWEMTRRNICGNVVFVVPLTPEKELILIRIYRIPLKSYVLELCAGLTDKKGEKEKDVAKRELLEETGYTAPRFVKLAEGYIDVARASDKLVFYLAENARKVKKPEPEESEDIEVQKVSLANLPQFLSKPPRNLKIDLKIWAIFSILRNKGYASEAPS